MSVEVIVAAFALLGVLCGALSSYIVAARKMGGKVSSTEASELWIEARSLREEATARIGHLEDKVVVLEDKVATLLAENLQLKSDKFKYENENKRLCVQIDEQAKKIDNLRIAMGKDSV